MGNTIYNENQVFGDWKLVSYLGGGGNGEVWKCSSSSGDFKAIKILKVGKTGAYERFIDEISTFERLQETSLFIPMVDKHIPILKNGTLPFYVMELAENAEKVLKKKNLEKKIDAFIQIAHCVEELHLREIAHRDIKPDNLLYHNSKFCLSDFGLVDYPGKEYISDVNEPIGWRWTIAPEMKRESSVSDGMKADIYSLAKTLWIILTEQSKGFEGQYVDSKKLRLNHHFPNNYVEPIEKLILSSTDHDPDLRPNIGKFIADLKIWKELDRNFNDRNHDQWGEIHNRLFPTAIPRRVTWSNIKDIVSVLNIVCKYKNLTHMFFPNGGGLDLEDVRLAPESGCIELDFQTISIVKPKQLIFESFSYTPDWNYFRLELDKLEKSEFTEDYQGSYSERVTELKPGDYHPYYIMEEQEDREYYQVDENSRHVQRWFRGCFVIFSKASVYNQVSSTYDGRHNKMTTEEFRGYIQQQVDYNIEQEKLILEQQKREQMPLWQKLYESIGMRIETEDEIASLKLVEEESHINIIDDGIPYPIYIDELLKVDDENISDWISHLGRKKWITTHVLYHIAKITQAKFPINTIDWERTFYYIEKQEYLRMKEEEFISPDAPPNEELNFFMTLSRDIEAGAYPKSILERIAIERLREHGISV